MNRVVRSSLIDELKENRNYYSQFLDVRGTISRLSEFRSDCLDDTSKWFEVKSCGILVANTYRRPVIFLQRNTAYSHFLPCNVPISSWIETPIIIYYDGIGHFKYCHKMKKGGVVPPAAMSYFTRAFDVSELHAYFRTSSFYSDLDGFFFLDKVDRRQTTVINIE
jgi:hypothetical protein